MTPTPAQSTSSVDWIGWIIPLALVFLHLQLFAVAGFPVTPALLVLCLWLLTNLDVQRRPGVVILALAMMTLAPLTYLLQPTIVTPMDFLRTLLLFGLAMAVTVHSAGVGQMRLRPSSRALFFSLSVISGFSALQNLTGRMGSEILFNPFGSHQYLYNYEPNLQFGLVRAQGFYLEPSFDAMVLLVISSVLMLRGYRRSWTLFLAALGIIATSSFAGLVWLFIMLTIFAIASGHGWRRLLLLSTLVITSVISLAYVSQRFGSFGQNGSSANFRIIGPVSILRDILSAGFLGKPLGSVQTTIRARDVLNGATAGSSLDNGYYLTIFYFGWTGILLCVGFVFLTLRAARIMYKDMNPNWPIPFGLTLLPVFTGGVLLPEFLLLIGLFWSELRLRTFSILQPQKVGSSASVNRHSVA